jgi:hypothetical protein
VVVGLNPSTIYWMVVSDARAFTVVKTKIKVAKWGTPKKNLKNNVLTRDMTC